jgi:MFS transporter, putative metabolite:H+ symporter
MRFCRPWRSRPISIRRNCLRAVGTGFGSAWFRAGLSIGPILVGWMVGGFGIRYVFAAFAAVALVGGLATLLFAIETKGRILEELSS